MFINYFSSIEDDLENSWKNRVLAHRLELLIASCLIVVVTLVLGIGLGGEELSAVWTLSILAIMEPL